MQAPTYRGAAGLSKLDGFIAELEQLLKADALRLRQDRRTGRALFAQLRVAGYAGGYSRVTDFISAWHGSSYEDIKTFVPGLPS